MGSGVVAGSIRTDRTTRTAGAPASCGRAAGTGAAVRHSNRIAGARANPGETAGGEAARGAGESIARRRAALPRSPWRARTDARSQAAPADPAARTAVADTAG
ncbi:hypothetical protein Bpla01_00500 [Burkholderia plantarii]|nr:hypothetical protein Bpla01_00500 [Burkholderia plantarii]